MAKVAIRRSVTASSLLTGLVSYWELDESSGTRYDAHGSNDLVPYASVSAEIGKQANAASFDVSSYGALYKTSPSGLDFGDSDFTVAAWVKVRSLGDFGVYRQILSYDLAEAVGAQYYNYGFELKAAYNSAMAWVVKSGFDVGITHYLPLSLDEWQLFTCWHDAANDEIGITCNNGANENILSWSQGYLSPPAGVSLALGARLGLGVDWMDGLIDEVGIWSRLLTTSEKAELYNSGASVTYPFV